MRFFKTSDSLGRAAFASVKSDLLRFSVFLSGEADWRYPQVSVFIPKQLFHFRTGGTLGSPCDDMDDRTWLILPVVICLT